jgi:TonB family protein
MISRNQPYPNIQIRTLQVAILFTLGLVASLASAQQSNEPLPTVTAASVPFYPAIARMARIQGVVRLRVSTDGKRVSSVEVVSGPPLLARLANDNVKTWLFKPHTPTTFEVTFRYKLMLPSNCDSNCNCEYPEKESVLLELPTDVYLTGKTIVTCDPVEKLKDK